ncbi:8340_t:CDS:2 [Funneliformis mosseae]|uniref:8340_t:CDS:1 n=1 Tax=Funneliformis mosseae TaxID=27381 RepID=A0A9N9DH40_FUNMO|nr:8340_t:CDS:2 [Funneliformis mosseae]
MRLSFGAEYTVKSASELHVILIFVSFSLLAPSQFSELPRNLPATQITRIS